MRAHDPAREAVLSRVRSALRASDRTPRESIPRNYSTRRPVDDLPALFQERVADYQATVRRIGSDEVPEAVAAVLREHRARRVLAPRGLPWRSALAERFVLEDGIGAEAVELDGMDAVVTVAAVGIALTGTIVLDHGPGQGRRAATLVPDVHICTVAEDQIVDDVPAALARLDSTRPLTFISGPSATSDIELDRVEGVHGPRHLHVLITADRPEAQQRGEAPTQDG